MTRPTTLIEDWLPFDAIGAESLRESGFGTPFPGPVRLHVWWARRPLTISRAAIIASLLPSWEQLTGDRHFQSVGHLGAAFPTEEAYRAWFLRLLGILGDPVAAQELLRKARERGEFIKNPYTHDRAFTVNPTAEDLALFEGLLGRPLAEIVVLDPFAGGGSIPFEARRYGLATVANELNPVAAVILKATLDYPARFGPDLAADIKKWGQRWYELVKPRLQPFFTPLPGHAEGAAYLWARTVACPVTGKPVPLSPNWWLSKKKNKTPVAVRLLTDPAWEEPRFEIVSGEAIDFDPGEGTVRRGVGRSPWTGDPIDGDYIKAEAQAGRMGQMLYAVALKRRGGFDFRPPAEEDRAAVRAAGAELARQRPRWEAEEVIPTEPIPDGLKTAEPRRYGMYAWAEMFSPRQLLALGTFVETLRDLRAELRAAMDAERAAAVETYLGLVIDKASDYNSRLLVWHPSRTVVAHTFSRHDFSFAWSHGEFDASANLLPWAINQVHDAYRDMTKLLAPPQAGLQTSEDAAGPAGLGSLAVLQGSAADLSSLADGSVQLIVTDPPYYDNVMYAELSDFFYVWLKRTVGHLYPDWFAAQLTDRDEEAVANPARFADLGRKKKDLAEKDYERKMEAAFREMHRVLADDGLLTVMFTHKRVEAWDTLAAALINAGFSVQSSWPVHTESEHSLHQAKKNAARSTILLACRKRRTQVPGTSEVPGTSASVWWDDIAPQVRYVAREKAAEFAARGIGGVDLYLSTFGPVLAVISEQWPVLTSEIDERSGQPKPLRPETALDLARQEVIALRRRGLLLGREVQFDEITDWYLMAWDAFKAERFPADEARKLALALGLDVERDLVRNRVVGKKGSDVILLQPRNRRVRGKVDPEADHFDTWLDAVHTTLLVYDEDGAAACGAFLKRAGLLNDSTFKACLQAMINAVPRTRLKGEFVRPEADLLDKLRAAFFEELAVPAEEEAPETVEQLRLV